MNHEKPISTVLTEIKDELMQFLETRLQLLRSEIHDIVRTWKYCIPLLLAAAVLLLASWIVITFAIVALVHGWFAPSPFAWTWAGLIVAAIYLVIAGVVGWFGYAEMKEVGILPKRTLKVLKQDQNWVESEARTI
jgi:energy-coupling factor transporter transmembrane protein EcfT